MRLKLQKAKKIMNTIAAILVICIGLFLLISGCAWHWSAAIRNACPSITHAITCSLTGAILILAAVGNLLFIYKPETVTAWLTKSTKDREHHQNEQ